MTLTNTIGMVRVASSNGATAGLPAASTTLGISVTNSAGAVCGPLGGCATGTIALTDNGSPLDGGAFGLNSLGYTEDQWIQLPGGNNSVQAQYPGDNSFNASSASTTYSITPASTTITAPNLGGNVSIGASLLGSVTINTQSSGLAPSGTVIFLDNGITVPGNVALLPTNGSLSSSALLIAELTIPFTTAGSHVLTATYGGDSNYSGSTSTASTVKALYSPNVTIGASPQNPAPGTTVTVTALVDASVKNIAPTGTVNFQGSPFPLSQSVTVTSITDANGNAAGQASITFAATANENVTAQYSGDSNYFNSSSSGILITVPGSDFTLYTDTASVGVTTVAEVAIVAHCPSG